MNRGDPQLGRDMDEFGDAIAELSLMMVHIPVASRVSFDAKVRYLSNDPSDRFHGHVGGMDNLARTLTSVDKMLLDEEQANRGRTIWRRSGQRTVCSISWWAFAS
jgi:xylose isomerase